MTTTYISPSANPRKVALMSALSLAVGFISLMGCSNHEATQAQQEEEIQQATTAIEDIKKDRSIPSHRKKMMIERIQMDLDEFEHSQDE